MVCYKTLFAFYFINHQRLKLDPINFSSSIKPSDKTYALGIGIFLTGVCAIIPSSIVMATFIDKSCLLWNEQTTNSEKYCMVRKQIIIQRFYKKFKYFELIA